MDSRQLTTSLVYLDEGDEGGGIAHPTHDLADALKAHVGVREVPITKQHSIDPRYWYRLGRVASADADVVHVQFEYGSFGDLNGQFLGIAFPVFARAVDVPIVTTLHNFRDRSVPVSLGDPSSVVEFFVEHATWFVDRSLVAHTDFFIPLMRAEVPLLRRHGVPAERIRHIPLVAETNPEFRDAEACKRSLGIEGKSVITAFGWVRRSKGYGRVIDVLDNLPSDTVFLVAGGTRTEAHRSYLGELKQMVEDSGLEDRVIFTGYVDRDDHATVMNATDVMVFPYRDNRASDAMARALSYHLPVVASDNEEFSAVEEEWGCVRTVSSESELATALDEVLTNAEERRRLRENAESYATEMNWDTVAERTVEIYDTVTEGVPARPRSDQA